MRKAKQIGLGISIAAVVLVLVTGIGYYQSESEKSKYYSLSDQELFSLAEDWEYDDILNNIENYKGKVIRFEGNVITADNDGGDHYELAVNVKGGNTLIVDYAGRKIISGDFVVGYGEVSHVTDLKSSLDDSISTYPVVKAIRISCINC